MNKNKLFEDYIDNPLDLDFDADTDSTAGNTITSGNQGTPQLLTLDQLEGKETVIDRTKGWNSADPKLLISTAVRLSKRGYQLVDYSYKCVHSGQDIWEQFIKLSTVEEIKKYRVLDYNGGYKKPRHDYSVLCEYVDRKNKIYYFCFGPQIYGDSMWC